MILNGLGLVSAPLYLFEQFFVGKATEHLLGEGVLAEHLNDDRLGRVLDGLYVNGVSALFVSFMAVHYVVVNGVRQIVNLTDDRRRILQFFGSACRQYYLLC